jgi:hypothetical protein
VRNFSIKSLVAIGIAGAAAMHTATALYAQILSSTEVMEQVGSSDLTAMDTFLVLGVLSGKTTATPASSNKVAGGHLSADGAYTMLDGVALNNNNKGPDDYFAPRYRDGKCVEDEGNTLVAEPTFGGSVRRIEGKSLERALASLCRKVAL